MYLQILGSNFFNRIIAITSHYGTVKFQNVSYNTHHIHLKAFYGRCTNTFYTDLGKEERYLSLTCILSFFLFYVHLLTSPKRRDQSG